mgnify:CR=1 FL=1
MLILRSYPNGQRKKGEEKIAKMLINTEYQNKQLVDFCNIVSHNLRAPLVNISILLDYMESCDDLDEKNEVLHKIQPVINHLSGLLDELVESLQVRQDTDIESTSIDLNETTRKILNGFEGQIQMYNAKINCDFNEINTISYPQLYIDSILTNLISNALKYKHPDRPAKITITCNETATDFNFAISDNGIGIGSEYFEKIFVIFIFSCST